MYTGSYDCVSYGFQNIYGFQTIERFNWPFLKFFFTLLENYCANSQSRCLIEKPDFGNILYFTGPALLLAEQSYWFRKVKLSSKSQDCGKSKIFIKITLSNLS